MWTTDVAIFFFFLVPKGYHDSVVDWIFFHNIRQSEFMSKLQEKKISNEIVFKGFNYFVQFLHSIIDYLEYANDLCEI